MERSRQRRVSTPTQVDAGTLESGTAGSDLHIDAGETSHLRPDGTVFPPVTPDPPAPPGYVSPVETSPILESPILYQP